jgi:hypothetical protein
MTDQPTPETDAKAATEESSATHSPPSDWPAYARALEIQRNAARAERDALRALRDVLQRIVRNGGIATNEMLFDARTALAK